MPDLSPEQIDQLARSIALHSAGETGGTGHISDFNASTQEDLVTKIKELLSDPKTEYMVNTSDQPGRSGTVIFFNEESKSILVFNPNNLADPLYDEAGQIISGAKGPDNLAGTFYREPKLNADGVPFEMRKGKEKLLTPETELSRFNKQVRSLKNGIASAISNETGEKVTANDIETHKINENDDWAKRISGHDTEIVEGRPKAQQRIDAGEYKNVRPAPDAPKPKPAEAMDVVADGGKTPTPAPTTGEKPVLPTQDGNLALDIKPEEFPDQAPNDIDPDIAETSGVKASQAADVVHPQTHIDDLKSVIQTGIEDGINFETNSDGRLTITPAGDSVNKYEIQLDFENKSGAMRVTKPNGEMDIIQLDREQLVKMNDMLSGIEVPGPEGGRIPNLEDTAKLYYEANPPKINIESPELRLDSKAGEVIPDAPKVGGIDNAVDATADIARGANTADNLADTMKTVGQAADALKAGKALSKTAKLSIIGGVALTGGVAALLHVAHEGQRGLAGELKDAGQLSPEAYEAYMDMNTDTEIMMQAENAAAQGWLFLLSTPAVEARASSDFKEWADKYAPNLSEEQYQALSMSMFPGNSARAEMLWDARDQLPSTTEGQPEFIHRSIDLNALYEEAGDIHYSYKEGYVYSGSIAVTLAKAQAMGIEVEPSNDPPQMIKNLKEAIKQELVTELDQQFRAPENIEHMLDLVPVDERMEYARRLAGSESDPAQFAKDHPEIAAYVKEYDESWFGWDWTLDNDDPLKANPDLLNDYIISKTQIGPKASAPEVAPEATPTQAAPIIPSEENTTSPSTPGGNQQAAVDRKPTPNDVIDRTSEIDRILPPDANFTVQSSDNNASVTRGIVPDEQISLVQDNDQDPATLPEVEQERARQAELEQQRLAELAQQQANAQMEQQQQPNTPTASR